jgi:ADP-ribose pyrophosphatase YjhB (NUDIX family)
MTLNPALQEARFCPRCAQPAEIAYPRSITCRHCGYGAYYNPKPVAAAIPTTPTGEIILLRRAFDPGKDLWTFPGGFVDLGESVEQAVHRETQEELGIAIELGPLVGVYSREDSHIVLIVFAARTTEEPRTTAEASAVEVFDRAGLPWDALAFWSTRDALRDFLGAS